MLGLNSRLIAIIGIFGSITSIISIIFSDFLVLAFPIIPYLIFDPAEIIVILIFLLFGPVVAVLLEIVHFLALHIPSAQFPVLGPSMKSLAVLSTLLGLYIGLKFFKFNNLALRISFAIFLALIFRNLIMTLANYAVLLIILPGFINGIASTITSFTGIYFETFFGKIFLILFFTAIYNSIHVFISVIPAYYIATLPYLKSLISPISNHWFFSIIKESK